MRGHSPGGWESAVLGEVATDWTRCITWQQRCSLLHRAVPRLCVSGGAALSGLSPRRRRPQASSGLGEPHPPVSAAVADGYTVVIGKDGREGLRMAAEEAPDFIYLDLRLPGLDGFEVLERLRSDEGTRHIPVIILTNYGEPELRGRGAEARRPRVPREVGHHAGPAFRERRAGDRNAPPALRLIQPAAASGLWLPGGPGDGIRRSLRAPASPIPRRHRPAS